MLAQGHSLARRRAHQPARKPGHDLGSKVMTYVVHRAHIVQHDRHRMSCTRLPAAELLVPIAHVLCEAQAEGPVQKGHLYFAPHTHTRTHAHTHTRPALRVPSRIESCLARAHLHTSLADGHSHQRNRTLPIVTLAQGQLAPQHQPAIPNSRTCTQDPQPSTLNPQA